MKRPPQSIVIPEVDLFTFVFQDVKTHWDKRVMVLYIIIMYTIAAILYLLTGMFQNLIFHNPELIKMCEIVISGNVNKNLIGDITLAIRY